MSARLLCASAPAARLCTAWGFMAAGKTTQHTCPALCQHVRSKTCLTTPATTVSVKHHPFNLPALLSSTYLPAEVSLTAPAHLLCELCACRAVLCVELWSADSISSSKWAISPTGDTQLCILASL